MRRRFSRRRLLCTCRERSKPKNRARPVVFDTRGRTHIHLQQRLAPDRNLPFYGSKRNGHCHPSIIRLTRERELKIGTNEYFWCWFLVFWGLQFDRLIGCVIFGWCYISTRVWQQLSTASGCVLLLPCNCCEIRPRTSAGQSSDLFVLFLLPHSSVMSDASWSLARVLFWVCLLPNCVIRLAG